MVGAGERSGEQKTVIVTGANRGIGLAVARALVARGCRVVMLSRDRERGQRALDDLANAGPGAAELVVGDLVSAREIRAAAAALLQACPRIDVLIHLEEEAPLQPVARDEALAARLWRQALELSGLGEEAPGAGVNAYPPG